MTLVKATGRGKISLDFAVDAGRALDVLGGRQASSCK
jgi:hypothetical protein